MKKMIAVGIISVLTFGLAGCSWVQSSESNIEESTEMPKTLEVFINATTKKTITPEWSFLENGAPLAKDPETDKFYFSNEVGEYSEYVPDILTSPTTE